MPNKWNGRSIVSMNMYDVIENQKQNVCTDIKNMMMWCDAAK